jgi:hypothetical protein
LIDNQLFNGRILRKKVLNLQRSMTKLTRYTSMEDLKASKNLLRPQKSISERELELREFIALLKKQPSTVVRSKSDKSSNQAGSGK